MRHLCTVLLCLGVFMTVACASHPLPESSITGEVSEVKIGEEFLTPKAVTVKPGEEVRWVNTTRGVVDISFFQSLSDFVSCNKGFEPPTSATFVGPSGNDYLFIADVNSNRHASLCFSLPGTYEYAVKLDEATTGKATRMRGTIRVQ